MLASAAACGRLPVGHKTFCAAATRQKKRREALPRAGNADATGGSGSGSSDTADELPPELQGLCISEDGQYLIDSANGKVVNEFGATRFDVAVRAIRGEFDPPAYMENTERSSGLLLDSLTQFPATYDFQLVVRRQAAQQGPAAAGGDSGDGQGLAAAGAAGAAEAEAAVLERYRRLIADVTAADIAAADCSVKPRLGGKYLSLTIPARVQAAHVVDLVWDALAADSQVMMKY